MRVLVTIPVFNEEAQLAESVGKLYSHLEARCAFDFEVTVADNGSEDRTFAIAASLSEEYPNLRVVHLDLKGRGRSLYDRQSELGRCTIARHWGRPPSAAPRKVLLSQPLPGAIEMGMTDGHVELMKLENLWQCYWHVDWQPPPTRPH